ncbi:hypothetical protein CEXT_229571 [Caerostris extrusa]|uniref:Uncharacterized protein n=1 Tax=Caerostris extrusa TaxID=172846 RepID=A0AAV4S436_CAEEX|nr:hypothetical protein CEXT_229571 [Caerostris extrusa]
MINKSTCITLNKRQFSSTNLFILVLFLSRLTTNTIHSSDNLSTTKPSTRIYGPLICKLISAGNKTDINKREQNSFVRHPSRIEYSRERDLVHPPVGRQMGRRSMRWQVRNMRSCEVRFSTRNSSSGGHLQVEVASVARFIMRAGVDSIRGRPLGMDGALILGGEMGWESNLAMDNCHNVEQ